MAQLNFDASTIAPQEAFEPLPAGWYPMEIIESEMKPTKAVGGQMLCTTMRVLGGDYANRKVFDRFNLQNANPVAVEIAYRALSAVCHAVGMIQVQDSQMLHGKPMQVKLGVRAARTDAATNVTYDASNEVKGYKAIEAGGLAIPGSQSGAPAWAVAPAAAPAPVAAISAWAAAAPAPTFAPPPPPTAMVAFPPAGWTAHPQAPGYYYLGQEVLAEADLRARMAPVVAPAPAIPAPPALSVVAPVLAVVAAPAPGANPVTAGGPPPWAAAGAVAPVTPAPAPVAAPMVAPAPAPVPGAVPPWAVPA